MEAEVETDGSRVWTKGLAYAPHGDAAGVAHCRRAGEGGAREGDHRAAYCFVVVLDAGAEVGVYPNESSIGTLGTRLPWYQVEKRAVWCCAAEVPGGDNSEAKRKSNPPAQGLWQAEERTKGREGRGGEGGSAALSAQRRAASELARGAGEGGEGPHQQCPPTVIRGAGDKAAGTGLARRAGQRAGRAPRGYPGRTRSRGAGGQVEV